MDTVPVAIGRSILEDVTTVLEDVTTVLEDVTTVFGLAFAVLTGTPLEKDTRYLYNKCSIVVDRLDLCTYALDGKLYMQQMVVLVVGTQTRARRQRIPTLLAPQMKSRSQRR